MQTELDIVQVNIIALMHLTKLFVRDMVGRRRGRILNVASTAAFQAGPGLIPPDVVVPGTSLPLPTPLSGTVVLPPGNYYLNGPFDVNGDIIITGETHIYVDGDVKVNGNGFINSSLDPNLLSIEVIGNHDVQYNGNSEFYGSLVAPESDLKLNGTADLYGTIYARVLDMNGNLELHVDVSLIVGAPTGGHAALVD